MLEQVVACMVSEEIIPVLTHMVVLVLILLLSSVVSLWHSCAETDNAGPDRTVTDRALLSPQLAQHHDSLTEVTAVWGSHGEAELVSQPWQHDSGHTAVIAGEHSLGGAELSSPPRQHRSGGSAVPAGQCSDGGAALLSPLSQYSSGGTAVSAGQDGRGEAAPSPRLGLQGSGGTALSLRLNFYGTLTTGSLSSWVTSYVTFNAFEIVFLVSSGIFPNAGWESSGKYFVETFLTLRRECLCEENSCGSGPGPPHHSLHSRQQPGQVVMSGSPHWDGSTAPTAACSDCWKLWPVPSRALKFEQYCSSCKQPGHPDYRKPIPSAQWAKQCSGGLRTKREKEEWKYPGSTLSSIVSPRQKMLAGNYSGGLTCIADLYLTPGQDRTIQEDAGPDPLQYVGSGVPDPGPPDTGGCDCAAAGFIPEMESLSLAPVPPTRFHSERVEHSRSWETEVPVGESVNEVVKYQYRHGPSREMVEFGPRGKEEALEEREQPAYSHGYEDGFGENHQGELQYDMKEYDTYRNGYWDGLLERERIDWPGEQAPYQTCENNSGEFVAAGDDYEAGGNGWVDDQDQEPDQSQEDSRDDYAAAFEEAEREWEAEYE